MKRFDRRLFEHFDWIMLVLVLILSIFGIITIRSVTLDDPGFPDYKKQIIWNIMGLCAMVVMLIPDYKFLEKAAPYLYAVSIASLLYILLFGKEMLGVRRWILLPGGILVQPSEFAKLALTIMLARWMAKWRGVKPTIRQIFAPAFLTVMLMGLILLEPDLGTSLVLVPLLVALVFTSGFSIRKMVIIALLVIIGAVVAAPHVLKDYQMKRITGFLHPEDDPLNAGYHLIQSKIAIGSGGLLGKGYRQGPQSHLDFLPVQDTDFIFSVWGEERGFVGAFLLLFLYFLVFMRTLKTAGSARDLFGAYLCVGFTVLLFFQVVINVGMVIGLMPITGLPLPFMSYGGTAGITHFIIIGVILNVSMRRFADYRG